MEIINFENKEIRTLELDGQTWYSVIDVVGAITKSKNPSSYWRTLKTRLKKEGDQSATKCSKLKLPASDGKLYETDCATREILLRMIQSIPSPSANEFKLFLANAGEQNLQETENPELLIEKFYSHYRAKGMADDWISTRMRSVETRNELTERWQEAGITKSRDFSFLTNIISNGTFDLTVAEHKQLKGLASKHNIRDNMTTMELVYIILAEVTAKEISQHNEAAGFSENKEVAEQAGDIAGESRKRFERKTGIKVVSSNNFLGRFLGKKDKE